MTIVGTVLKNPREVIREARAVTLTDAELNPIEATLLRNNNNCALKRK